MQQSNNRRLQVESGIMPEILIDTARLWVRALTVDHLRRALTDVNALSPELNCRFAPGLISDRSRGAIGIKIGKMAQSPEGDHPWYTYWLLLQKRENIGIGLAGFKGPPDQDQQVEVGYGIASAYQGNGYMTEAVMGLVQWAFSQPGCRVVTAETLRENLPSQRVLVKAGFEIVRETGEALYWQILKNPEVGGKDG